MSEESMAWFQGSPKGPDPNNRVVGPKYYNIHGIWAPKPYDSGPWTLRVPHHLESHKSLERLSRFKT